MANFNIPTNKLSILNDAGVPLDIEEKFQTLKFKFLAKLADYEQEILVKKNNGQELVPFCQKCAQNEFSDRTKNLKEKIDRMARGETNEELTPSEFNADIDFKKYTGSYLTYSGSTKIQEKKLHTDAMMHHSVTGFWLNFKCPKGHACSYSVDLPYINIAYKYDDAIKKDAAFLNKEK